MQSVTPPPATSDQPPPETAKWWLEPMARLLRTGEEAATIDRLFVSQHVRDLRLIVAMAQGGVLLVLVFGLLLSYESEVADNWSRIAESKTNWVFLPVSLDALSKFLTFFGPVLAVYGGVLAWAYQTGSARLGVVDLFACEISTLCKVATVAGTAHRYIEAFAHLPMKPPPSSAPPVNGRQFTSQENYFPVFEANNRDLQSLEARVVINITAFYTYMKSVRDSLRTLATVEALATSAEARSDAARNVIYMLFLGLESARLAVTDLVEFEPEEAERRIVILLSELEAFTFLCEQYRSDDMHYKRIMLRRPEYERLIPPLMREVETRRERELAAMPKPPPGLVAKLPEWEPAWRLLADLDKRYTAALAAADRRRPSAA
ncbi:MAG: hypothetical protein WDN69_27285 [Aliidongia sp.]